VALSLCTGDFEGAQVQLHFRPRSDKAIDTQTPTYTHYTRHFAYCLDLTEKACKYVECVGKGRRGMEMGMWMGATNLDEKGPVQVCGAH